MTHQFGFKVGHSTDLCIYTLKEFIDFYKKINTTAIVTFLDASKEFDRIGHWILFKKIPSKHSIIYYSNFMLLVFPSKLLVIS